MGTADKSEKQFMACRDVFAEMVNVLLYAGKDVLHEDSLQPAPTESIYIGSDGEQHSQFRDFGMYDIMAGPGVVQAVYLAENQGRVDRKMPLREAGYQGASYRSQYRQGKRQGIYPVISIVLNWGKKPWDGARSIRELLAYPVPEGAEDYLDKNAIHVFDMRYLKREVRERFEGDMRIILDYLSDRRSLARRNQKLRNPEEVMRMLYALSGDERYLDNITFMEEEGGRKVCDLLDEMVEKGIKKGVKKGINQGITQGIEALIVTCRELGVSFEETACKVTLRFHLTEKETEKNMKLYW